ncbi:MAG: hypothetical protein RMK18_05850 [Armatimonadota bacterium]|nr:hypothetical protein [Armatimonadota bacterium]MCX7777361.1 hypothetical protein [Armatimonadota bacterium]MDW8025371.1 hypothetical protein [Armatimonadota bacterium]
MRGDYRHTVILRKRLQARVERHRWELLKRALPSLRRLPSGAWKRHIRSLFLQPRIDASDIWIILNLQRQRGKQRSY